MSPRKKRFLKLGCLSSIVFAIAATIAGAWFARWIEQNCIAHEPDLQGIKPAIVDEPVKTDADGTTRLGKNWSKTTHGVRFLYLTGFPYEIGFANARLSQEVLERQEDALYKAKDTFVPSAAAQWLLRKGILFIGRTLPDFVSEKRKLEVLGLVRGSKPDRHAADAPLYHRVLHYHAIHDYAHKLIDNPLIKGRPEADDAGCSAFAATSEATSTKHVLLARNFDMELDRIFDEEKVVLLVRGEGDIPFVSVAWSGMAGAVSGLNAEGIACVLNASASDDDETSGEPVSFVVREILERAHTLEEAIAIVRKAPVFVSDNFVLVSGKEDKAVVVEKSPRRCAVREAKQGLLLATNHFLTPEFSNDKTNGKRQREATTEERFARLEELVTPLRGKLDLEGCVSVLRDKRGSKNADLGLGNRSTLDALIATHSVVIDATARTLWVTAAPHALGAYLPVSLEQILKTGELDPRAIEAGKIAEDPLLESGGYARHLQKRKLLRDARNLLSSKEFDKAERVALEARAIDPAFFEAEEILARVAKARGDSKAASAHARAALERFPPYARLREELAKLAQ